MEPAGTDPGVEVAAAGFGARSWLFARRVSAWFLVYVAVCGTAGFAVRGGLPAGDPRTCLPFISVFGAIASACPNDAINMFWMLLLGIPRFLLVLPAIAIAEVFYSGRNFVDRLPGLVDLIASLLFWAILFGPAVSYWRRRRPAVALVCLFAMVIAVLSFGSMR